jgi:branched-chain amino acid transport system permease protein
MELLGSIVVDGVAYSFVLFLISIGLAMTLGLMRIVNMAHGAFAMFGGFIVASPLC